MSVTALEMSLNGEARSIPQLNQVTININLFDDRFMVRDNNYTLTVFYGRPPNYGSDYPVTTYYLYTERLRFEGNLNSLYSVAQVNATGATLSGEVTVSHSLPYTFTIKQLGSGQTFTLEPGQTSLRFDIPLEQVVAAKADQAIQMKLAEFQPAQTY